MSETASSNIGTIGTSGTSETPEFTPRVLALLGVLFFVSCSSDVAAPPAPPIGAVAGPASPQPFRGLPSSVLLQTPEPPPVRPSNAARMPTPVPAPSRVLAERESNLGGRTGSRVAAVLLMLPLDADGTGQSAASHTYKVSLDPGSESATVEIDGRGAGSTPVRRVYPQGPARVAPPIYRSPTGRSPNFGSATVAAFESNGGATNDGALSAGATVPKVRTAAVRPLPPTPTRSLNPNGAPIID